MDPARQRLALGDSDDERPFKPASAVAANKIARFQGQGTVRKSKFELEREAEAERQRKEAEEAAAAYKDFVESFGGDDETGPSNPGARGGGRAVKTVGRGFVKAGGGEKYNPLADRPAPPAAPPSSTYQSPYGGPTSTHVSAPPAAGPSASAIPTGPRAMTRGGGAPSTRPLAASFMADDDEPPTPAKSSAAAGRKKRAGDDFLEQLKRFLPFLPPPSLPSAQIPPLVFGSSITALAAREHAPVLTGSYDTGDPLTTNIHVGGLPQNVTEEALGKMFAQFGPIGSVKIMWPRLDSGQLASVGGRKLGGFVAYLRRPDAERASKEMDGVEWGDNIIKISWGKAVPVAARAMYEPEPDSAYYRNKDHHGGHRSSRHRSRSRSRSRSHSPTDPHEILRPRKRRSRSPEGGGGGRGNRSSRGAARSWPELEDGVDEQFLVTVAKKVRDNGKAFEEVLRQREKENPRFAFLTDEQRPSYHYFRMLVDPDYEPPVIATFDDEGNAEIYSSDSEESSEDERVGKGKIGRLALRRFECLLRGLTSSREKIARGMMFALEHADCASHIADILVCSLTIDSTPVPRKLARLHLVSDILHNAAASVPNAWVYRSIFEKKLPAVFDHLGDIYLSFPGRLKAEQFRGLIEKVIDVWANDWMLFEPGVTEDFKRRLAGLDVEEGENAGTGDSAADMDVDAFVSTLPPEVAAELQGVGASAPRTDPAEDVAESAKSGFKPSFKVAAFAPATNEEPSSTMDEDLDGAPVDADLDGSPVVDDDVDGSPVVQAEEDVDGAPVAGELIEEEDVDGAPVADDVDGQALDGEPLVASETKVVSLEDDDGEAMELASDEDIFQ
ncbi:hypothetical protein B0A53_05653 [Rhodotorula sp. CCFEE 5036]|nr:hypothetical protein B0A53_05653 [Rhodotorula sp. CCFEE 5036]